MALAQRFEELMVWQMARLLTKEVYAESGRGRLQKDFGLRDQLQRAAVSVMSNIAEGFERRSRKDFAHFLGISMASLAETKSLLYVATDLEYLDASTSDRLLARCAQLRISLGSFLKSLRANSK